jgi:hypothetical protein
VIPFIIEFIAAADFTLKGKIYRALRNNVPFQIIYFLVFIVLMIILACTPSGRERLK